MNAPDRHLDWTEANQRLLVAEFARIRASLAPGEPVAGPVESEGVAADGAATDAAAQETAAAAAIRDARSALRRPGAIDALAEAFGLSTFERAVVLLAAGVEMDRRVADLCAGAAGRPERPWATFGLALAVLPDAHWSALAPHRPLRRWRLIEVEDGASLAGAPLRLDERVLHYLAGVDGTDPRVAALLRPVDEPVPMARGHREQVRRIAEALEARRCGAFAGDALPPVQLHGDDAEARADVAAGVAARIGWRLRVIEPQALTGGGGVPDVALLATLCEREAALGGLAFFVDCAAEPASSALLQFMDRMGAQMFVGSERPLRLRRGALSQRVERASAEERRELWREVLGDDALAGHAAEFDAVVAHFGCGARRIAEIGAALETRPLAAGALWRACRDGAPARLAELARRIEVRAGWDDLILPAPQKALLGQIVVHARRRFEVHGAWGFGARSGGGRGLGITALFTGESGTGKTLAAEVLAGTLELDLFRIDLSAVVSKYIGETEKNLKQVFDAAEDSGAMLLFDEADALFGKRSDVKDSHDRYANIEVSYLLQRMEGYGGLAVLTTNHRATLDAAFMRRLRFVVAFPYPEAAEREAIWRRAFPAATPTRDLDYARLARLQVAGGHIHNIALGAAFQAADEGVPVGMAHLLRAAHADAAKRERAVGDAEIRGWT